MQNPQTQPWNFYPSFFTDDANKLVYNFTGNVICNDQVKGKAQYFNVTFKNSVGQEKTEQIVIPVIYGN